MRSGGIFKIKLPRCSLLIDITYSSCEPTLGRKVWSPSECMNDKLKNVTKKIDHSSQDGWSRLLR